MNRATAVARILLMALAVIATRCSMNVAGGNSSQTGNAGMVVAAMAGTISGTTAPNAQVSVYAENYRPYASLPGFADSTVANDTGTFALANLPQGYCDLLVHDALNGKSAFVEHIPVFPDSSFTDTVKVLESPGYISGIATDTAGSPLALSYVFAGGSPFYCVANNAGGFLLGPLPAGRYTIGMYANLKVDISGAVSPAVFPVNRTGITTVYPDSTTPWHW
jgi:hypothetical protein